MKKHRITYSGITAISAGCFDCNGSDGLWFAKNALAVAARHHDATGHRTWCDQVIMVRYGEPKDEK